MARAQLVIVGGGLVGASLALARQAGARARGWRIVLVEPFAPGDAWQPSYDARSSALSYGSRQIFERLGLWPALAERAEAITRIQVSDQGRFGATRLSAGDEGVPALGYVLENAWMGHCLWRALDPGVVEWRCPAEVTRMEALDDGYRLFLDDVPTRAATTAKLDRAARLATREGRAVVLARARPVTADLLAGFDTKAAGVAFVPPSVLMKP